VKQPCNVAQNQLVPDATLLRKVGDELEGQRAEQRDDVAIEVRVARLFRAVRDASVRRAPKFASRVETSFESSALSAPILFYFISKNMTE
jgi:hypothetical protein